MDIDALCLHTYIGAHGVPCIARLTHWQPALSATRWEPGVPEEIEFELLDEAEQRDPSLDALLTSEDRAHIESELLHMARTLHDELEQDALVAAYGEWD